MKLYSSKANARRAARTRISDVSLPIEGTHYTIEEHDGKFGWRRIQTETKAPTQTMKPAAPQAPAAAEEPAPQAPEADDAVPLDDINFAKKPRQKGSVAKVWEICEANKDLGRKDVINICVSSGINFYTARTQYQAWFKATNDSKK
tara:strand:+ start:167 stop:604 length:438 start_codon:yes stop_codon:yes gene_type:complete